MRRAFSDSAATGVPTNHSPKMPESNAHTAANVAVVSTVSVTVFLT